ncbi:unnamed protein product [Rhizopus stolonifer]
MSQQSEYTPGTIVFAKLKGYPWWPGKIELDKNVPPLVLERKTKNSLHTVYFFGSKDYGFFGTDAIRPFHCETVEANLKAKKFRTKLLESSVREALNLSLSKKSEESTKVEEEVALKKRTHRIVIKGAEEEEEGQTKKRRMFNKDEPSNKKDAKGKERIHIYEKNQSPEKEPEKEKIPEKETEKETENVQIPEKEPEMSVEEGPTKKSQSTEIHIEQEQSEQEQSEQKQSEQKPTDVMEPNKSSKPDPVTQTSAPKKTSEFKKVYHIRHQLQRLVYNKKEGEIPKDKYPEILAVLQQIEEAPMSYNLLRDTKVGKVVRAASVYPFEDNVIKERCIKLLRYWKTKYIDTLK